MNKSTIVKSQGSGEIKKVDEFGRISIPLEVIKSLELSPGTELNIKVDNEKIILSKK